MASQIQRALRSLPGRANTSTSSSPSPVSSTAVSVEARRKWGLGSVPSPRSILSDDNAPVDLSEDDDIVNGARPNTPPLHLRRPPSESTPTVWKSHRETLKRTFPQGWSPPRKLSREAMDGLRELHRFDSEKFSTPMLAERFKISPEAVRRILKSKWEPSSERRVKWALKQRQLRDEKMQHKRQTMLKERQEVEEIWLAGKFKGGLSLKG